MDILDILQLLGGVGLFLYGMNLMADSIEKLAGSGLERILERLTVGRNRFESIMKGWGLGVGVTAIIQSSAATTIMLIGFVNAGIMKVVQAVPVVFGANVGSTMTAQILRLGDIGSSNIVFQLLKPSSFAPMLAAVGAIIILLTKNKSLKNIAGILLGLGILFYGMTNMEEVFEPLKESATFQSLFTSFSNPFIGILIGLVVTAIIQSSSASVGILQALTATGTVTYSIAVPIIIGANIGKCGVILISGIGANKKAKRLVVTYLLFNIIGAVVFSAIIYAIYYTVGISWFSNVVNRGDVANVHLLFNVLASVLILPFTEHFTAFTAKVTGDDKESDKDTTFDVLDDRLLNTPAIALDQCKQIVGKMVDAILENYKTAAGAIYEYDETAFPGLEENESFIDKCETALSAYIIRIDRKKLSRDDKLVISEILNSISDLERMGDYCMNIAYVARDKNEHNIHFSPNGHRECETIVAAVEKIMEMTFKAFKEDDAALAVRVEPMSETIDKLKEIIKNHHVDRLQEGECSIEAGVPLFDLLNSCERMSSHASNVALHIIKRVGGDRDFDEMHGHAGDSTSEEYKALYHYYESQYVDPIAVPLTGQALIDEERRQEAERRTGIYDSANAVGQAEKDSMAAEDAAGGKTIDGSTSAEGEAPAGSSDTGASTGKSDRGAKSPGGKTADTKSGKSAAAKKDGRKSEKQEGNKRSDGKLDKKSDGKKKSGKKSESKGKKK